MNVERIERALMIAAYIVDQHGPEYGPIFERLEQELADAKRSAAPVDRARRLLEAYTLSGEVKAIR